MKRYLKKTKQQQQQQQKIKQKTNKKQTTTTTKKKTGNGETFSRMRHKVFDLNYNLCIFLRRHHKY